VELDQAKARANRLRRGTDYRGVTADFAERTHGARKVLGILLGGLGDVVHGLPAFWAMRRAWPQAELHVMVPAGAAALLKLAPWLDQRHGYAGRKAGLTGDDLGWYWKLYRGGYDVCVNFTGSNHASILAWATRAPHRLGRRPWEDYKPAWRRLHTEVMDPPHQLHPMYRQWVACLGQAGLPDETGFHIELPPGALDSSGIAARDRGSYLHLSPCTTADYRQLPVAQMVELLERLHAQRPELRQVLSAAGSPRERSRIDEIVGALSYRPWKVLVGQLDVAGLAAIIENAAIHLSGDTGPLHLAVMLERPTVSWFRIHPFIAEYLPDGPRHRAHVADSPGADALHGIATADLYNSVIELLDRQQ
jgi:lipopolysaccharide heptosyltransferase III